MAFCKECGNEVEAGAAFCVSCGTPTGKTENKSQAQPEQDEGDKFKTQLRKKPVYGVVNLEDLPQGHIIDDRYEVKSKLGQGGFGAVYRVFDKKMKIDKALKVLPEAITGDREAMESLGEEAATMVRLNHQNIVRVFDFQEKGRIKYIDMEFVDGKSLTDIKLDSPDKKLPESEVKKLASQIATGLAYAHSKNVIHRDIKPQNILLSKSSKIKIMDFGISETVRSSMSRVENSSSSGTLVYMSPEQIKGMNVGREADIYSFGAMLYELLSGKAPFNKGDISYQILNEKPVFIEGVSDEMNQFLQKCLAKDYKDRFRHFDEVKRALNGEAVSQVQDARTWSAEKKESSPSTGKGLLISIMAVVSIIIIIAIATNINKASNSADQRNVAASAFSVKQKTKTGKVEGPEKPEKTIMSKPVIRKARLHVNTSPSGADIKILNIRPAFVQGIALQPGKYHISVSKKGYSTAKQWVELVEDQTKHLDVRLKEIKSSNAPFANSVGMNFVYIKPGSFTMGSNNGDSDEKPVHGVTLSRGFYMQTTEVTVGQWTQFINETAYKTEAEKEGWAYIYEGKWIKKNGAYWNNSGFNQTEKSPVTCVSWNDSKAFAKWLSQKESANYRLPTEAEWEYACRAGSDTDFANGNSLDTMGWYDGNSGSKTHSVAGKRANDWGLYDMHGNVWEWCEDWYGGYQSENVTDTVGPSEGSLRVLRGGSWNNSASNCRSALRGFSSPGLRVSYLGFRLARTP